MIKLNYTTEDIIKNELLRNTVQTLLMIGAKYDDGFFFDWDYPLPYALFPYVDEYYCFIKMSEAQRNGDVFAGLPWGTTPIMIDWQETWDVSALSFSLWKDPFFTTPVLLDWFYYIPSDIRGWFNWEELQIFLDKKCEIITISQYQQIIIELWVSNRLETKESDPNIL